MIERPLDQLPHALPPAAVVAHFGTDPVRGLTRSEAVRRLTIAGPNELPAAARAPAWRMLLAQCKNVLIMILLVAIGLSLVLGHAAEAVAIAVIALFSVMLGFIQERRAERALEALRRMSAPHATVMRDGEADEVPSRDLVPGDIIVLEAGDIVPADARLLEAINLRIDEAALTGESSPVGKGVEALPEHGVALGDRTNLAFSSTAVTTGADAPWSLRPASRPKSARSVHCSRPSRRPRRRSRPIWTG
jgi:P-type Ca2+ transporter type 2C